MTGQLPPVPFHDARLSIPEPAEDAIHRRRLTRRLDETIRRHRVTIVTGAGGTGKTYAVAMWSNSVPVAVGPGTVLVAWASLDRADGEPHRFWLTVVGALRRAADAETIASLAVPSMPTQYFVDSLAAALAAMSSPLVLVLDDVHELAGSSALESLEQLQRSMPLKHHLVLVSRHDPPLRLHRLRLAGELGEVRAAELAFTTAEAAEMLRVGGLELGPRVMERLMATTEGWAAGLRLATVAIEPAADPAAVVAQFDGRHALVSAYLLEEVVAGLGADRADFLLRTSIVDRVCAPLARALTDNEAAGMVLDSLVDDNVLVSALEDSGWCRYHPMLLEMLRARLRAASPSLVADLHRRAQVWFEHESEWLESLHHAVLSGDEELATHVTLRLGAMIVFTPERGRMAQLLATIPTAPALAGDSERQLRCALAAYSISDSEATSAWLDRAESGLASISEPRRQIAMLLHRLLLAAQARRVGDPELLHRAAEEALRIAADSGPAGTTALAQLQRVAASMAGVAELWLGRPERAETLLRSAIVGADQHVFGVHAQVYHGGFVALCKVARGLVREARARAKAVLDLAQVSGSSQSYESGAAWLTLAIAGLHSADLTEAERCLTFARQTQVGARDPFLDAVMRLVDTRSALTAGDLPRARRTLTAVDQWLAQHSELSLITVMRGALSAEIQLAAGAPHAAAAELADLAGLRSQLSVGLEGDPVAITRGHVLLAMGRPQSACAAVAPMLRAEGADGSAAWLVTALAQDRLRQDASSTESLSRALACGEAEDAVQGFLRRNDRLPNLLRRHLDVIGTHRPFAERVLARLESGSPVEQAARRETPGLMHLTERELSVLAYLPTLSTNPEIAEQLSISVNTVKQHLKTINRKLSVSSRREAVRAARRLGLLPDAS